MKKIKLILLSAVALLLFAGIYSCADKPAVYDGEFLEKKLTQRFTIDGILLQNGEKYDVSIDGAGSVGNGDFKIKFLSGDVTEGLTVEFFENGVFLFFDDLRFKTNSETFTNLESLKNSFEILAAAHVEKYVTDAAPVEGIDIIEIGVNENNGEVKAYVNKIDGTIIRLSTNLNGSNIIFDVKKFENVIEPVTEAGGVYEEAGMEEDTSEIFQVVDDYIGEVEY
jgi:hypothetical protein